METVISTTIDPADPVPHGHLQNRVNRLVDLRNALSDCAKSAKWAIDGKIVTGTQPFYILSNDGIICGSNQSHHREFQAAGKARGGRTANPISHSNVDATVKAVYDVLLDEQASMCSLHRRQMAIDDRLSGVKVWFDAATKAVHAWRKNPERDLEVEALEVEAMESEAAFVTVDPVLDAYLVRTKGKGAKEVLQSVEELGAELHAYRTWHDNGGALIIVPVEEDNTDRW